MSSALGNLSPSQAIASISDNSLSRPRSQKGTRWGSLVFLLPEPPHYSFGGWAIRSTPGANVVSHLLPTGVRYLGRLEETLLGVWGCRVSLLHPLNSASPWFISLCQVFSVAAAHLRKQYKRPRVELERRPSSKAKLIVARRLFF